MDDGTNFFEKLVEDIKENTEEKYSNNIFTNETLTYQESVQLLSKEILGDSYYITDPLGIGQACYIMTEDMLFKIKRLKIDLRFWRAISLICLVYCILITIGIAINVI